MRWKDGNWWIMIIWCREFYKPRDLAIREAWEEEVKACKERIKRWSSDHYYSNPTKDDMRKMYAPRK